MLQQQVDKRPASAAVVAQRLRQLEQETRLAAAPPAPAHFPPAIQRRVRHSRVGVLLGGLALAVALLVGVGAACYKLWSLGANPATPPAEGPKIKIGILHSQKGMNAPQERPIVHALQLAVEEINQEGGVLDKQLEIREEDGESDEDVFARKARNLILDDEVVVLFGCWSSGSRRRVAEGGAKRRIACSSAPPPRKEWNSPPASSPWEARRGKWRCRWSNGSTRSRARRNFTYWVPSRCTRGSCT